MRWLASTPGSGKNADSAPKVASAKDSKPRPASPVGPPPARPTRQRSISRRITRLTTLVSATALLLAGLVFFGYDIYSHYASAKAATATLARVAAENVRTPMDLGYVQTARATLEAMTSQPDITAAAVFRANGRVFASSERPEAALPANVGNELSGSKSEFMHVRHFEPVMQKGRRIGTVVVESTLAPIYRRSGTYAMITAATLLLAWLAARWLAGRLQHSVSGPIVELAAVAEHIAKGRDYKVRAEKRDDGEVGELVDAFNKMLGEIQRRDEKIHQAHLDLETNVLSRTSELHQQIEDRKQAQAALKESEQRYRSLFENNPIPLFVVDPETLDFIAVNLAAVRHYGYTEAEFLRRSLPSITIQADSMDIARKLRSGAKVVDAGAWKHRKRNGDIIEVHVTAHAFVMDGKVAKIVLADDVTERNRIRRELDDLNDKLVEASRQAGMAEIATGVLHNLGNVLNSVNVSASVLVDSVQQTKATSLRKLADLLAAHAGNLAAFFVEGGKGTKLPRYLLALSEQLAQEQRERLSELELLVQHIEHIKQVVMTQQDYAKVAGLLGNHQPARLVEDALKMVEPEFQQERIHLAVDSQPGTPEVHVDRHKVLQILLNLLANARQAMEKTPEGERRVSLLIRHAGSRVQIIVRDCGCGIPPENLTLVFNHGFTTKPHGHGFGLHASANAAREMDGSLTAASSGRGATFTLELPASPDSGKVGPVPKA